MPRPGRRQSTRSLELLGRVRAIAADTVSKSGIMVGLGETRAELRQLFADLRRVDCDMITIGQYLQPSRDHLPVTRFVPPEEFAELRGEALALGFRAVAAGPFVRSSYQAETLYQEALAAK